MARRKVLIDSPTQRPALGYQEIAGAFAELIAYSEPKFAIGIFGGWGSGKTTLMQAIARRLKSRSEIVCIDFNAWRFEREPHLLVPLLDTIREELGNRAMELASRANELASPAGSIEQVRNATMRAEQLRHVVIRLGKIVQKLASGLSVSVPIPGLTIKYDVGSIFETSVESAADQGSALEGDQSLLPKSLYVAAFKELRSAVRDLAGTGVKRIVVFVDDLDRCLPENALDVLESMKHFFDLDGFIFVVGLDESLIQRAVAAKFASVSSLVSGDAQAPEPSSSQLSTEYAKKIFQVPYALPAALPGQLNDLLESMYKEARIGGMQLRELEKVPPYLKKITMHGRVNPRQVKRFINSYTLQSLIGDDLIPEVILALQVLAFRQDWEVAYKLANSHPSEFLKALDTHCKRQGGGNAFGDLPGHVAFPADLAEFLMSPLAAELADLKSLDPYLSSRLGQPLTRLPLGPG
jgi:energy-coupling factor transporter ATP-binding protein EcfA2